MKKKIFLYLLIIFHVWTIQASSLENRILIKVNNTIITVFDVKQEEKYLIVLNPKLKKIDQKRLKIIARDSILKEKIKEIELAKYFQIEKFLDDPNLKKIIKNLYQKIGFQKENEFKNYLEIQNLEFCAP